MEEQRRPIGYWLKHLDRLIEETFDRTLAADGLTRRQWQVLNSLHTGRTSSAALANALQPFIRGDISAFERVIDDLAQRGLLYRLETGDLELSDEGLAAHDAASKRVDAIRQRLRRGITDDEYVTVVTTLQRMASNLE